MIQVKKEATITTPKKKPVKRPKAAMVRNDLLEKLRTKSMNDRL